MYYTLYTYLSVHWKKWHILWAFVINCTFPKDNTPLLTLCLTAEPTFSLFSQSVYLSKLIHKSVSGDSNRSEIPEEPDTDSYHGQNFLFLFFYFSLHRLPHARTKFINSAWYFSRVLRPDSSALWKEQCRVQWSARALSASNLGLLNLTSHL